MVPNGFHNQFCQKDLFKRDYISLFDKNISVKHSALRSLMLLLALSFHGVFEVSIKSSASSTLLSQHPHQHQHHDHREQGLAVGLQQNSSEMLSLTIAVIVHEAIMSFRWWRLWWWWWWWWWWQWWAFPTSWPSPQPLFIIATIHRTIKETDNKIQSSSPALVWAELIKLFVVSSFI